MLSAAINNMDAGDTAFVCSEPSWFFLLSAKGEVGNWGRTPQQVLQWKDEYEAHNGYRWFVISGDRFAKEVGLRKECD